jgi:hypothetical protein
MAELAAVRFAALRLGGERQKLRRAPPQNADRTARVVATGVWRLESGLLKAIMDSPPGGTSEPVWPRERNSGEQRRTVDV